MCGIFGIYDSTKSTVIELASKILAGLSLLEYRGYDSAGLLLQNTTGHAIICKTEGNVSKLQEKVDNKLVSVIDTPTFNVGISHTRWATHGQPCDVNSHPHVSDAEVTFAVVHNGIITNYKDIRDILERKGFTFESQTDTEVIPKLCLLVYNENPSLSFEKLVTRVMGMIEGSYALLVTSRVFPNEVVACKYGSPLLIGNIAGVNVSCKFSSDVAALVGCDEVYIMRDKELLHVTPSSRILIDGTNKICTIAWTPNQTTEDDVSKGSHDTYMKKEIFEQPEALMRTIQNYMYSDAYNQLGIRFPSMSEFTEKIRRAPVLFLLACGTSWHACVASRWLLAKMLDKHVYVEVAGQFVEVKQKTSNDYVYMFVSQSGETAETVEALRYVKSTAPSALCVSMTNKPGSTIAREATCSVDLKAGLEISVASTKAYTSQMIALALLAANFKAISSTKLFSCLQNTATSSNLNAAIMRVPDLVRYTLITCDSKVKELAQKMLSFKTLLFVGRASDYATALESALKVKEISYMHCEGIMASELKHGPLAMIDDTVGLIVFATKGNQYKRMISVIEQLNARKAHTIAVCNENDLSLQRLLKDDPSHIIEVPQCDAELQHIINIIPMQLLAFHLATLKGNKVDQPRNLAKSVTVSD